MLKELFFLRFGICTLAMLGDVSSAYGTLINSSTEKPMLSQCDRNLRPISAKTAKAMAWQGPRHQGGNFFFNQKSFEIAQNLLLTNDPVHTIEWGYLKSAGFDVIVTIRSPDGSKILGQGRLGYPAGFADSYEWVNDQPRLKNITLFDGFTEHMFPLSAILSRNQLSIAYHRYEFPKNFPQPNSDSEFAQKLGITSLHRYTVMGQLLENLKSGVVTPVPPEKRTNTEWNEVVYLSLSDDTEPDLFGSLRKADIPVEEDVVYMSFSTELLDRSDYWITAGWDLGQFLNTSIRPDNPDFRRALYLRQILGLWGGSRPEIVFAEDIPIQFLTRITARPGRKQKVISYLKKQLGKVPPIDLDKIVIEHD